jgi:hypothetical protein
MNVSGAQPDPALQREHPRYELRAPVEFEEPAVSGETRDISFGGIAFELPDAAALPLGGMVRFTIRVPGRDALTLSANLCWRSGNECGVAFEGLDRAQRLAISELVDQVSDQAD